MSIAQIFSGNFPRFDALGRRSANGHEISPRNDDVRFCRGMARPHVPHDGAGHTCSRPRERPAACCHLSVPDVRGQRTGPESSE